MNSPSMVTATLGPNDPVLGTRAQWNGDEYVFVYNAGNSTIAPGKAATVSGVSGYSVTVSTTASMMFAIGMCKHASITTGTYGWLLTKGYCQFEPGADVSAGEGLAVAADGDFVNASGITGNTYGKAMEAVTGAASGTGYFVF